MSFILKLNEWYDNLSEIWRLYIVLIIAIVAGMISDQNYIAGLIFVTVVFGLRIVAFGGTDKSR